ncbi:saccharopine dehydrogenase, partial [Jimgerdemannia flammicorona]
KFARPVTFPLEIKPCICNPKYRHPPSLLIRHTTSHTMTERKYDLVVFGATGFTGGLAAEHLARAAPKGLKWALAGRSLKKLEDVRQNLVELNDSLKVSFILSLLPKYVKPRTGSQKCENNSNSSNIYAHDPIPAPGPPSPHRRLKRYPGAGCHHAGNPRCREHYRSVYQIRHPARRLMRAQQDSLRRHDGRWVKQIIAKYNETAIADGTIIVPCCAFDSVPSDLGTLMCVDFIRQNFDRATDDVKMSVTKMAGGLSGGTIASSLEGVGSSSDMSELTDPYLISPVRGVDKSSIPSFYYDRDFGGWQAMFFMAVTNERVVRRSAGIKAQQGEPYGKLFKEWMTLSLYKAVLFTLAYVVVTPILSLLLKVSFMRTWIVNAVPAPGTGPTKEELANADFEMQIVATADTEPYEDPIRVVGRVKGFADPGYVLGSMMAVEGALAILCDADHSPGKGGILTPATALGHPYVDRLRAQGMVFEVQRL